MAGGDLAGGKRTAADLGAWLVFEDESGQGLRPPKGCTWGRRNHAPVVRVTGEQPLPALFKYTPYLRAYMIRGEREKSRVAELYRMPPAQRAVLQDLDLLDPRHRTGWLAALVQQGYAAIVVERPGTGASFGTMDPTVAGTAREADQVLDWIAAQGWPPAPPTGRGRRT